MTRFFCSTLVITFLVTAPTAAFAQTTDVDDWFERMLAKKNAGYEGVREARQHAARLRHNRKDVARLAKILGPRFRRNRRLDRASAIVRRNAGCDSLGRLDRNRKVRRVVIVCL